ncbi:exported hypothetical protein [uncultured Paludibacter sp.]|nr:exported hypothetical protein [uncultured Paludibacter sp.]
MKKLFVKIFSVITIGILLLPSVAKLEHHHFYTFHFNAESKSNSQSFSEQCEICQFEFFAFVPEKKFNLPEKFTSVVTKYLLNDILIVSLPKVYNFSLRAPPFDLF